ncbi:MFS transporter [Streptomyces sp. NPDC002248]
MTAPGAEGPIAAGDEPPATGAVRASAAGPVRTSPAGPAGPARPSANGPAEDQPSPPAAAEDVTDRTSAEDGTAPTAPADEDTSPTRPTTDETTSAARTPPATRAKSEAFDRGLIAPMVLGSVLNPVNSSMLAVALVPIGRAFDAGPAQTAWLVTGLYLATAVGQPVIGRLVDAFGPRPLYLGGTALVGLAGVLGVCAPALWVLVVSRVLLGLGTSAAYPASMSLLRSEADRTGAESPNGILSTLSLCNQVIAIVGPSLGGALIGLGGWHLIFGINVPLSLACLVLGARRLPRRTGPHAAARERIDHAGMALFAGTLTTLMLFLMSPAPGRAWLPALAALLGAGFAVRELRAARPFIDLRVLGGNAPLLATYGRQFLASTTSYAFLYGFTQWLAEGRGLSASVSGLLLLPMPALAFLVTALTGRRAAIRPKLLVGATAQLAGCAVLLLLGAHTPLWALAALVALVGLPQGLNGLANQSALYAQADPARMGASAGLLRTFMYLGALVASVANAAFFAGGADTAGLHHLALLLLGFSAAFLVLSAADRSLRGPARRDVPQVTARL